MRVFAVHLKILWVFSSCSKNYEDSDYSRLCECQADLSVSYAYIPLYWFVIDAIQTSRAVLWEVLCVYEPRHEISSNVVCALSKGSDQHVHMRSLIRAFASRLYIFRL